jgi:formylmethanofuran dehydrogenase subunit D
MITRISLSLISYQDGRKGSIIADGNRGSTYEHAAAYINMRAYEMLNRHVREVHNLRGI